MTREETIKVLQSIEDRATDFPYMTACDWVAIAAAKRHLSDEKIDVDLAEERMKECPYKQVICGMYEGHILECKGACSWVVDYMTLKEHKAQKGGGK